jgi:chalcone isomerase-like protein
MNRLMVALLLLFVAVPAFAQEVAELKTGTKFSAKDGDMTLLGVGLRTKTVLKVKVYAIGLYVADSVSAGPLKGKAGSPQLYPELVNGDFKKEVIMKFVRDVSQNQIRDAFRETLAGAGHKTEIWLQYFGDIHSGQELVIGWTPGIGLETKVAGVDKPPINDKAFASAVFAIWLGDKPVQEDMKKDLVARAGDVLK